MRCAYGIRVILLAGCLAASGLGVSAAEKRGTPFEIRCVELPNQTDPKRANRRVPLKVHYPVGDGPFPLVVFSHGGMGTWDAHLHEARNLAAHGYVAVCVEHVFSNLTKARRDMRKARGTVRRRIHAAVMRMTTDPQAVLQRPRDVSFAIDQATQWQRGHRQLKGLIDTKKIAVAGHSFGAYTVLVACGARPMLDHLTPPVPPGRGLSGDLSDPRVTIGIAMSPQGPGTSRFNRDSYKTINRPMLCFSGTRDRQFGFDGTAQPAVRRLEAFKLMPPGDKYMLWLDQADHMSFAINDKSHRFASRARADTARIVFAMQLAFCDAYLKDDKKARACLTGAHANSLCGDVVRWVKWHQK